MKKHLALSVMLVGIAVLLASWSFLPVVSAVASGLESSGIGARGRAMGYAMVAVADDWTAIQYNPAGLVQIEGHRFGFTYEFFNGSMECTASLRNLAIGANPARGDFVDPIGDEPTSFSEDTIAAPIHSGTLGYVANWGTLSFGTGLYGSGSGTGWEDQTLTGGDLIDAEIAFTNASVNVPIALAYKATPDLSLGLALNIRYGLLTVDINKYRSGRVPYTMATTQDTDGIGVSADLGGLWKIDDRLALGVVLKLPYTLEKSGETTTEFSPLPRDSTDTTVEESYPLRLAFGCAYRPDDRSLLAFSMTWLNWSDYNMKIKYSPEKPLIGLVNTSGNPADWHDTVVVGLGYERELSEPWTLRCGLSYDQAPEPRSARTLVGGQVVDSWKFSVGAGVRWDRTMLDFGYTLTHGPEVEGFIPGAKYGMTLHEIYVGMERQL